MELLQGILMEGLSSLCRSYSKTVAEKKAWEMVKQQSRCDMLFPVACMWVFFSVTTLGTWRDACLDHGTVFGSSTCEVTRVSRCLRVHMNAQVGPCDHSARGRVWAATQLAQERRVCWHASGACHPWPKEGCAPVL